MIKPVSIVPTILSNDKQIYHSQVEKINLFTKRAQIDITDGVFAKQRTLDITTVWWPKTWTTDLHLMVMEPSLYLDAILRLHPSLCIMHAEAKENLLPIFETLKKARIKTGVAMLQSTYPGYIKDYIKNADHVLIFAGSLGSQGGKADLMQMEKIPLVRSIKPEVEIGWDGGANITNIRALAHADLDVINVGSAISRAPNPVSAYQELVAEIDKNGVLL